MAPVLLAGEYTDCGRIRKNLLRAEALAIMHSYSQWEHVRVRAGGKAKRLNTVIITVFPLSFGGYALKSPAIQFVHLIRGQNLRKADGRQPTLLGLNPTSLLPGAIRDHGVLRPEK